MKKCNSYLSMALLPLLYLLPTSYSQASCSVSGQSVSLGATNSTSLNNSSVTGSGTAGLGCSGLSITVLNNDTVKTTLTSTNNNLTLVNNDGSGDNIPYTIYADKDFLYPIPVGQEFNYNDFNLLGIFLGSGNLNIKFYFKTALSNVRSGTYTDTANFLWTYNICGLLGIAGICLNRWQDTDAPSAISITLNIDKNCEVTNTPDVNFGEQAFVGQFDPVSQSITLQCTKTEGYVTYFSAGNNASGGWNRMLNSVANDYLDYNFYVPNTNTIWNNTNKQSGIGTGLSENVPYQVKLNPTQPERAQGDYLDNVVFTIEY